MPQFVCKFCNPERSFKSKRALDTHAKTHAKIKKIKCKFCGDVFNTKDEHVLHNSRERARGNGHQGRPR